jgi:hypothetical protein
MYATSEHPAEGGRIHVDGRIHVEIQVLTQINADARMDPPSLKYAPILQNLTESENVLFISVGSCS